MNIIVRDADKAIVMYSDTGSPEPGEGCRLVSLDDAQTASLEKLLAAPSGGITFDGKTFVVLPLPPPPPPPTPEQKLAAAGLTVAELKQLLGVK